MTPNEKMGIEIEKMERIIQKIRTHIEVMEKCTMNP
jgi:hypothetical protein